MAKFKVEYETTTKPSGWDLPPGAKVTEVSAIPLKVQAEKVNVLPATIYGNHAFGHKYLRVSGDACDFHGAIIETPDGDDICLTGKAVDALIDALQEARKGG